MKKSLKYGIATAIAISTLAAVAYTVYDMENDFKVLGIYGPKTPSPEQDLFTTEEFEDPLMCIVGMFENN